MVEGFAHVVWTDDGSAADASVRADAGDRSVVATCGRLIGDVYRTARQIVVVRFLFRLTCRIRLLSRTSIIRSRENLRHSERFAFNRRLKIFRSGMSHDSPSTVSSGTPVRSLITLAIFGRGA
jgi:hypothetical protein